MASDQVSSSVPASPSSPQLQAIQAWLARLGLSGKLLAAGGLVGVIAVFLPLVTMSMQMPTLGAFGVKNAVSLPAVNTSQSVLVIRDMRGVVCLVGYVAALALAFVLYPPNGLSQKALAWAGLGVGASITLLALWLLLGTLSGSGSLFGLRISVGFGAILNMLASAAVTAGGFLKAREEIFPTTLAFLNPQQPRAREATPAQSTAVTAAPPPPIVAPAATVVVETPAPAIVAPAVVARPIPAPAISAATQPPAPPAVSDRPPPLPFTQAPATDARNSRDKREKAPPAPASSVRKPAGTFPLVLASAVGGSVAVGMIVGLAMWKFRGAESQPANPAIAQQAPDKQGKEPAAGVLPSEKESEPVQDAANRQNRKPAPVVLAKEKASSPGDDAPDKQNQKLVSTGLPKSNESKPGNGAPVAGQRKLNLMPIVDLNVDVIEGRNKWRLQDQLLICDTGHFVPRVQIRYVPPEEYDFSVTFTQTKNLRNGVMLIMPKPGGGTFVWTVGHRNGTGYGFGPDGKNRGGNVAKLIQINTSYTTTVQVRRNRVNGFLDGQLLLSHPTDFRDLDSDNWRRVLNDRILAVACDDPTTFQRIHLAEVTGNGKAIR